MGKHVNYGLTTPRGHVLPFHWRLPHLNRTLLRGFNELPLFENPKLYEILSQRELCYNSQALSQEDPPCFVLRLCRFVSLPSVSLYKLWQTKAVAFAAPAAEASFASWFDLNKRGQEETWAWQTEQPCLLQPVLESLSECKVICIGKYKSLALQWMIQFVDKLMNTISALCCRNKAYIIHCYYHQCIHVCG